jgi:hypothetical protein
MGHQDHYFFFFAGHVVQEQACGLLPIPGITDDADLQCFYGSFPLKGYARDDLFFL